MITGLTLLDIIEAIVVILALIWAQHKIRKRMSKIECELDVASVAAHSIDRVMKYVCDNC